MRTYDWMVTAARVLHRGGVGFAGLHTQNEGNINR